MRMPGRAQFVGLMTALLLGALSAGCPRASVDACGDGRISEGEACDDGNRQRGDGCSEACALEGEPKPGAVCGNGRTEPGEACDDGNSDSGDGCTSSCLVFQGWGCSGTPSRCTPVCGDGLWVDEACDDGNLLDGDGCSAVCTVEPGWTCGGARAACTSVCGDGRRVGAETCDDGNELPGDGCSPTCVLRDFWVPIPSSAFTPKIAHSAVWTGSEMLIWSGASGGGRDADGFRYSPRAGVLRPLSTTGAPVGRESHVTLWTGSEMFVWGGFDAFVRTRADGGIYNPASDTWRAPSSIGAPGPRLSAAAVWTGSEILIFGGNDRFPGAAEEPLSDGFRYDVARDVWVPMNLDGAPTASLRILGAWTGREMFVTDGNTASAYDPALDRWRDLALPGPLGAPLFAEAIGGEVVIIGETASQRFDPALDLWSPMPQFSPAISTDEPPSFVATGSEIVVYNRGIGEKYVLALDRWRPIAPWSPGRELTSLVWTNTDVLAWGGRRVLSADPFTLEIFDDGGRYDPRTDIWTDLDFPQTGRALIGQSAVWTGTEMLTFGGNAGAASRVAEGAAFRPSHESWRRLSETGAPSPRAAHAAVWTGTSMIIWGGTNGDESALDDGGVYDLASDTWRPITRHGAPSARGGMFSIWAGREMIVWSGSSFEVSDSNWTSFEDGGRYDPAEDVWRPMSTQDAPWNDFGTKWRGVWTGSELILWNNESDFSLYFPGEYEVQWGVYSPEHDAWSRLNSFGAPTGQDYAGVWTGEELIVLGIDGSELSGARYDPKTRAWTPISLPESFLPRSDLEAVWTGSEMFVWGGRWESFEGKGDAQALSDGARYDPRTDRWTPFPLENAPVGRMEIFAFWTGDSMIIWGDGAPGARLLR